MPRKIQTPIRTAYDNMLQRCNNPKDPGYHNYGGRGITVCPQWQYPAGFQQFCLDMGPRPEGTSLDRYPDNDGNYEPGNTRWATRKEQARNRRETVRLTIEGNVYLLAELAELTGIKPDVIKARALAGMTYEEVTHKGRVWNPGAHIANAVAAEKARTKTHCKNGHEFTPENTHVNKHGHRVCRTCNRDRHR